MWNEFFNYQDIVFIVVVGIEVGDIEIAVCQYDENVVVVIEFA